MAVQRSFSLEEEELSCPICFEEFNLSEKTRHPKLLWCLHTFCLACMETLRKYDGSLQCSICRTSHHVYRVCDLMDNYVIFEHLRFKQEYEDEKLATQLKAEFDASEKVLIEQEERDAQLARAEEEKNRLEEENLKQEEELRRLEEQRRLEEERRLEELRRFEEQRRIEEERERERRQEMQRIEEERNRLQEIQKEDEKENGKESDDDVFDGEILFPNFSEESLHGNSEGESSDTRSERTTDAESEAEIESDANNETVSASEQGDDNYVELASTDDNESETSVVDDDEDDDDDYETISSDSEEPHSINVISSDDEEDMGTALSTTAPLQSSNEVASRDASPSTSPEPEPDLLSEEFSGVAQSNPVPPPPLIPREPPLTTHFNMFSSVGDRLIAHRPYSGTSTTHRRYSSTSPPDTSGDDMALNLALNLPPGISWSRREHANNTACNNDEECCIQLT